MKRVFYCLILTAAASFVLSSCGDAQTTMLNQYRLHINFKDAAGNDLVASLGEEYYISESWRTKWVNEINPDKYSLDIILSDGVNATKPYYTLAKYNDNHSWLIPEVNGRYDGDGTWYLESNFVLLKKGLQTTLTYRLSCPTIFGDDIVHEIVAWWEEGTLISDNCRIPTCIKAIYDGMEIQPIFGISYNDQSDPCYSAYFLDIVLDR